MTDEENEAQRDYSLQKVSQLGSYRAKDGTHDSRKLKHLFIFNKSPLCVNPPVPSTNLAHTNVRPHGVI